MDSSIKSQQTSLSDLFDNGFKLFNSLQNTSEPTNSLKVQLDVKKCMGMFEDATKLVSMADMFSNNEIFEEMPTEQIKYFLLPALLGTLTTQLCDRENRIHFVNISEVYFYDFLERVKSYEITDVNIPKREGQEIEGNLEEGSSTALVKADKPNTAMIEAMVHNRQNKLQKFKEEKELKEKLEILQKNMDNPNIDDESIRNYFITLIKLYVLRAVDEIHSLAEEKKILEHMAKIKRDGRETTKPHPAPKLKPIIITRNEVQKSVYGAGYPSLPVMTVDEFYEKKVADGEWAAGTTLGGRSLMEATSAEGEYKERQEDPEDLEKERKIEADTDEYLTQARALDDYKDTHKRGWGNRHNRS